MSQRSPSQSMFLIFLDQTIVATAIPRIASDFNDLEQVRP